MKEPAVAQATAANAAATSPQPSAVPLTNAMLPPVDFSLLEDTAVTLAESGRVPDRILRAAIRRMCAQRLQQDVPADPDLAAEQVAAFVDEMRRSPVALVPDQANEQHYEVPAAFFREALGARLKYSCCLWPAGVESLDAAEVAALERTVDHAALDDGRSILELGCGWGSLTLWMAERFPDSSITAVSNSASQRAFIETEAARRKLGNVEIVTADMNDFDPGRRFDRVVSIEMFEHMRNWPELCGRVARWLEPEGRALVHVFCNRSVPYAFTTEGASNWMGRHFFTGGIMPSDDLMLRCSSPLRVLRQWRWAGSHYRRTAEAWLANVDRRRDRVLEIMADTYGPTEAKVWLQRWRMFFLACAELFGFDEGRQWWVSHYQLAPV